MLSSGDRAAGARDGALPEAVVASPRSSSAVEPFWACNGEVAAAAGVVGERPAGCWPDRSPPRVRLRSDGVDFGDDLAQGGSAGTPLVPPEARGAQVDRAGVAVGQRVT